MAHRRVSPPILNLSLAHCQPHSPFDCQPETFLFLTTLSEETVYLGTPEKTQAPKHLQFTFLFPLGLVGGTCQLYLEEAFVYWAFPLDFTCFWYIFLCRFTCFFLIIPQFPQSLVAPVQVYWIKDDIYSISTFWDLVSCTEIACRAALLFWFALTGSNDLTSTQWKTQCATS